MRGWRVVVGVIVGWDFWFVKEIGMLFILPSSLGWIIGFWGG